jgi:hypothetical protein
VLLPRAAAAAKESTSAFTAVRPLPRMQLGLATQTPPPPGWHPDCFNLVSLYLPINPEMCCGVRASCSPATQ